MDGTISKTFPIKERYKLEFRFEAYNLTNSLMWANPNDDSRATHCSAGPLRRRQRNRGREMQYTLRLQF